MFQNMLSACRRPRRSGYSATEMAVWQFSAYVVPEQAIPKQGDRLAAGWGEDAIEGAWKDRDPGPLIADLTSGLRATDGWTGTTVYGAIDASCIYVSTENGRESDVLVRCHARDLPRAAAVADIVKKHRCVFLTIHDVLIAPDDFVPSMTRSDAARFVANPRAFIEAVAKRHRRN